MKLLNKFLFTFFFIILFISTTSFSYLDNIYDNYLKLEIKKFIKSSENAITPLSVSDYNYKTYNVFVCYPYKISNYLFKTGDLYCKPKELTLLQILEISNNAIIFSERKLEVNMYSAINFTHGRVYFDLYNISKEDIDDDGSNETIGYIIPHWNFTFKPRFNVTVVVIDTGVDDKNPWIKKFKDKGQLEAYGVIYNPSTGKCELNNDYLDDKGHGTFVISEIFSLNPYVKVISLKPKNLGTSNVICAIKFANSVFKGDIVSMSLGHFPIFFDGYLDPLYSVIDEINGSNNKIMFSIANGNNGDFLGHRRLTPPESVKLLYLNIISANKGLLLKDYNNNKFNISFYDDKGNLIGKVFYNFSTKAYNAINYTSTISFDIDKDGYSDIFFKKSDITEENNLEIYFNTSLENLTVEIKSLNKNDPIDLYAFFLPNGIPSAYRAILSKYYILLNKRDPYSTILSPAIYPSAFSIGSVASKLKFYFYDNSSSSYITQSFSFMAKEEGDLFKYSSRGVPKSGKFEIKKPELVAPGIMWGANYQSYLKAIFNKTFNDGNKEYLVSIIDDSEESYIRVSTGTSMACPFFSGVLSVLKGFFKYENREFFRKLIDYLTFNNSYTQDYDVYSIGRGIIDLNKTILALPDVNLVNYTIDYENNKIILDINLSNKMNIPYNISFFQIIFEDDVSNKTFNYSLNYGLNELQINMSDLNISEGNYNIYLSGEIKEIKNYTIPIFGFNLTLLQSNWTLFFNRTGDNFSLTKVEALFTLNYSLNNLGKQLCFLKIDNNSTTSFNVSFGINKVKIKFPLNKFRNKFNFTIYCDKNENNDLIYNFELKDLVKQDYLKGLDKVNLLFVNNATINNKTIDIRVNIGGVLIKPNNYYSYSINNKTKVGEFNVSFLNKKSSKNKKIDSLTILTISNYTINDLKLNLLNKSNNLYVLPMITIDQGIRKNEYCKIKVLFYNTTQNKTVIDEFINSSIFDKKENNKTLNINVIKIDKFKVIPNLTLVNVTLHCIFNDKNQSIIKKVNLSFLNKNFYFTINQSSFFDKIIIDIDSNYTKEKIFVYNNNSLLYSGENITSLDPFEIYPKTTLFCYNYENLIENTSVNCNWDKYKFTFNVRILWTLNKNNITYYSLEKNYSFVPPKPKVKFKALYNNTNKSKFNIYTVFKLYGVENENKTINYSCELIKKSFVDNKVEKKNNEGSFKNNITLFNFKYKDDGTFNLTCSLTFKNITLAKFQDNFIFDTIKPVIKSITINKSGLKYYKDGILSKVYINDSFNIWISFYESHFDKIHLDINGNIAVVKNITNESNNYNVSFFVNKSILNFGENTINIKINDSYGNIEHLPLKIIFDNKTPSLDLKPKKGYFYNYIIFKVKALDDYYPCKIKIKNNETNETKTLNNQQTYNVSYLQCVPNKNKLIFKVKDPAFNSNVSYYNYTCFINLDNFNLSKNFQIHAFGDSNKSVFVNITFKDKKEYIEDNYKFINYSYLVYVKKPLDFLYFVPEEENMSKFKIAIYKDDELISETYNVTTINNNPIILLDNPEGKYKVVSTLKELLYDLNISLLGKVFVNKIVLELKPKNIKKVEIKNLNNSKKIIVDFNKEENKTASIPCIDGLNNISVKYFYNNSIYHEKNIIAYCNNKIIKSDVFVDTVILSNVTNNSIIVINDSKIPDVLNETNMKKRILINFTNLTINYLTLRVELGDYKHVNGVYLNKSNEIKIVNNYTLNKDYLIVNLNLKDDPILIIDSSKENEENNGNNNDNNNGNNDSNNNNNNSNNNDNGKESNNNNKKNKNSNNANNKDSYYGGSSSSSSGNSGSSGNNYGYSNNENDQKNEEKIIINESLIYIKKKVNSTIEKIDSDFTFIEKIIVYSLKNKTIEISLSVLNNSVGYIIKANKIRNASVELDIKEGFKIYTREGGSWVLYKNNIYFIQEGEIILVKNESEEIIPLNKPNKNEVHNKFNNNEEKINNQSSKNSFINENYKKEDKTKENFEQEEKENKKNIIWTIIKILGIGIIIFLIADFIDFLIKRKKGLI